jgi:hypothetical protein
MEKISLLNDNKNRLTTWTGTADVDTLAILLMLRRHFKLIHSSNHHRYIALSAAFRS